jgi:hypothetical protein
MSPRRAYIQSEEGSCMLSALPIPNTMLQTNETKNKTTKDEIAKSISRRMVFLLLVFNQFL